MQFFQRSHGTCDFDRSTYLHHQVLNQRAALLSNYEVLTLLKELESNHLARTKTALRIKKEEEAAGHPPKHQAPDDDVCENLRTVEVEVSTSRKPLQSIDDQSRPTDHKMWTTP